MGNLANAFIYLKGFEAVLRETLECPPMKIV